MTTASIVRRDLLGHHALGAVQPVLGLRGGGDHRRQLDRIGDERLQRGPALGVRALQQHLVVQREQVEGHERRRHLHRQLRDARGGRVDALAQPVELLVAVRGTDDQLAVDHVAALREDDLREVARERLTVS